MTLAAAAAGTAGAADLAADIARCRALADGAARLACYDALVPPAPAPAAAPAAGFGLENRQPTPMSDTLESRLSGRFEGWGPKTRFRLDNGQVWQVIDGSSAATRLTDPKVRITRGSMGTFFMQFEGLNQQPRVRRVE